MAEQVKITIKGRKIAAGCAEGEALVAPVRISFWGGFEPKSGKIVEVGNPLQGQCIDGKVLIFISTKGSSGTSGSIGMAKRMGYVPAAFVTTELDALAALACVVHGVPMLAELDGDPFAVVKTGDWVKVDADNGVMEITRRGNGE